MWAGAGARWAGQVRNPRGAAEAAGTALALAAALAFAGRVLLSLERRTGATLADPLLAWFEPMSWSWPVFALTYGGLLLTLLRLAASPPRLLRAVQTYILLLGLRLATLWALPLEPPNGIIPVTDPLVAIGTDGITMRKDLFFSGHVATLVLCGIAMGPGALRAWLFAAAGTVGLGLIWQHAHYTIDVAAAPFFAAAAWGIVRAVRRRLGRAP